MVVNLLGDDTSEHIYYLTNIVTFPVYQDTTSLNIWSTLDGRKDDILVYDRCGQLTYHIRIPYSHLQYDIVERAIKGTFFLYDPCSCAPTTPKATTTVTATAPATDLLTTIVYKDDIETQEPEQQENEENEERVGEAANEPEETETEND